MAAILDESGKARSYHLRLNCLDFAGDLAKQMLEHAQSLEKYYGELQAKVSKEKNDVADYERVLGEIDVLQKWFDNSEAWDRGFQIQVEGKNNVEVIDGSQRTRV